MSTHSESALLFATDRATGRARGAPLRVALRTGLLAVGLWAAAPAAQAFYEDAAVRAILFSRETADTLGSAVVVLAHQTDLSMNGNGRRSTEEHWIWYVADPGDPACAAVKQPRIVIDRTMESFGLRRCRIYRGDDTLAVEEGHWELTEPQGWPEGGADPYREMTATLPPLEAGDVVELAYTVENRWTPGRYPSDWVVAPITVPYGPTVERHILLTHNASISAYLATLGTDARIIEHLGHQPPKYELLTGNLPPGPPQPTGLDAPRLLFTSAGAWSSVRQVFERHSSVFLRQGEELMAAVGDSLASAHRQSRPRLQAVMDHLRSRIRRYEGALTASTYYARNPQVCVVLRSANRMEWALLVAALAGAARLKVETYLAREGVADFDPGVPNPHQFDRVLLRALVTEEDRFILFDPWNDRLTEEVGLESPLLLPITPAEHDFYTPSDDQGGYLTPVVF